MNLLKMATFLSKNALKASIIAPSSNWRGCATVAARFTKVACFDKVDRYDGCRLHAPRAEAGKPGARRRRSAGGGGGGAGWSDHRTRFQCADFAPRPFRSCRDDGIAQCCAKYRQLPAGWLRVVRHAGAVLDVCGGDLARTYSAGGVWGERSQDRRMWQCAERICRAAFESSYLSLIHISEPTRLGMISY